MPIEKYLIPNEKILFVNNQPITFMNKNFWAYITDKRIILFRIRGILFHREEVFIESLLNIKNLHFYEIGTIRKKGVLKLTLTKDVIRLSGDLNDITFLTQYIQTNLMKD